MGCLQAGRLLIMGLSVTLRPVEYARGENLLHTIGKLITVISVYENDICHGEQPDGS